MKRIIVIVLALLIMNSTNTLAEGREYSAYSNPDHTCKIFEYIGENTEIEIPNEWSFSSGSPYTVTSVGGRRDHPFSRTVESIIIPEGVNVDGEAFFECLNLRRVVLPTSIKTIEVEAFARCENLTEINIPEGVERIGDSAFWYCSNLTSIDLPQSLLAIDNCAFDRANLSSVIIPNGVTEIGNGAFCDNPNLTYIDLPNSIEKIDRFTFSGCKSLKSIYVPEGVKRICQNAFSGDSELKDIYLPKSLSMIERDVFDKVVKKTMVIHGVPGSFVERWAKTEGYQFIGDYQ